MQKPMYQVIENDIKEAILNGVYQPHQLIPSENELREKYNVARMTIRHALTNLVNDGYLYRHQGKGTYVADLKLEKNILRVRGFTEEIQSLGKKITNKVLRFEEVTVDEKLSEKLFLTPGDKAFYIERVRSGNNIPVLLEKLYLPVRLFKNLKKEVFHSSFYDYIENVLNYRVSHCMQIIEARNANAQVAKHLEINKNDSVLFMTLITYLSDGRPFEYVESYYRADQYRFIQKSFRG